MVKDLLPEYWQHLNNARRLTKNTLEAYSSDLARFEQFVLSKEKSFTSIDRADVVEYVKILKESKLDSKTIGRQLATLRGFYKYLILAGYMQRDPTVNIESPKSWQALPNFLTQDDVTALLAQPDDSPIGYRDRAILQLLYATGIRASELINIKLIDVNLTTQLLTCLGKSNRPRNLALNEAAIAALMKYLPVRASWLGQKNSDYLFLTPQVQPLTRPLFWRMIVEYGKKAGLGHVTPHMLRHTFATQLLAQGADLRSVQAILGNSGGNAPVTTHVTNDRLREIYERCHPRAH
jgi:integrase/recombinase XerD